MKRSRRFWLSVLALGAGTWLGNDLLLHFAESPEPSVCSGEASSGRLEHGKRMPSSGSNWRSYSRLGSLIGRTHVHEITRGVLLQAFETLEETQPGRGFVLAETGWPGGGSFAPHRTHQAGGSVDLHLPLMDGEGRPARFPANPLTLWGYCMSFTPEGALYGTKWEGGGPPLCVDVAWGLDWRVDFEATAALLLALNEAARDHDVRIERIHLENSFRKELIRAEPKLLLLRPRFSDSEDLWVRHDEHVHVDFDLGCD
jgi:penicillin-insensitive murein endopeptidase